MGGLRRRLLGDAEQGGALGRGREGIAAAASCLLLPGSPVAQGACPGSPVRPPRPCLILSRQQSVLGLLLLGVVDGEGGVGGACQQVALLARIEVQAGHAATVGAADRLVGAELQGAQPAGMRMGSDASEGVGGWAVGRPGGGGCGDGGSDSTW